MAAQYLSSNPSNLCQGCRGVNIESLTAQGGYNHPTFANELDTYISDFDESSTFCALCKLLEDAYSLAKSIEDAYFLTKSIEELGARLHLAFDAATAGSYLDFRVQGFAELSTRTSIFLMALTGDPASSHGVHTVQDLANTASERSLNVARNWIQNCTSNHDCGEGIYVHEDMEITNAVGTIAAPLPRAQIEEERKLLSSTSGPRERAKRLIDLTAFGEHSMDARLVDSGNVQDRYAALSYCWGAATRGRFITTVDTLPLRMKRIDYSLLPLTLQHAFTITRRLGIRYLWIDAICILQDSKSDWEEESSKMGTIYSESYVTIAADWGDNANSGCFNLASDRLSEDKPELIRITSRLSDGRQSSLYLGHYYKVGMPEIENSELTTRAWSYQERLLSPRILHFIEKQLLWECRQKMLVEDEIPRLCGQIFPCPGILKRHLKQRSRRDNPNGPIDLWYDYLISGNYARRRLTVPSDKLPAISALARLWAQHIKVPYLAGIWDHDLQWGLCWHRIGQPGSRSLDYRAPSWSWASVDCDISWVYRDRLSDQCKSMVCIEQASVQPEGKDPFGRLIRGSIQLTGRVKQFRVSGHGDATSLNELSGDRVGWAYMDTDYSSQLVTGLSLTASVRDYAGWILLLAATPNEATNTSKFVRKGLAKRDTVGGRVQGLQNTENYSNLIGIIFYERLSFTLHLPPS